MKCLWFLSASFDKRNCRLMWQAGGKDSGTDMGQVHGRSKCCMQRDRSKTDETANLTTACNARRGLHSSTLFLCPPFCRLSDPPSDPPTIPPANHPSSRPWPRRVECWPQRKIEKHLIGNYEPSACLSKKTRRKTKAKDTEKYRT